jgi:CBS domain containing-hemolysin-like protein
VSQRTALELIAWYWGGALLGWMAAACVHLVEFIQTPLRLAESNYVSDTGIGWRPFALSYGLWFAVILFAHAQRRALPWPLLVLMFAAVFGYSIPPNTSMHRSDHLEMLIANPIYAFDRLTHSLVFGAAAASFAMLFAARLSPVETPPSTEQESIE